MEEGGEKMKIMETDPMYAFHGHNSLMIGDTINFNSKKCQNWLIVDVEVLRVQPK
jgi:hypothetical protein